ncbi:UPF0073 inner membrane protein YqfA [Coccomyxa sp. Obi]|nr:UPF0073 inner membrane protein YqfA [Coccomyxa sp. Obi]
MSVITNSPDVSHSTTKENAKKVKPKLRGTLHQHAIFAALAAGPLLVAMAPTSEAKVSCAVYVASLVSLFTASAVYHRATWTPEARRLMKKIDHASIFLLIAGTYTPIAQLGLGGSLGRTLLIRVWTGAAAGILKCIFWVRAPRVLSTSIYIGLGWLILPHAREVGAALGSCSSLLLVLGGVTYSIGGIAYAANWPDPSPKVFGYHEVFHALVILASMLHFAAVYLLVQKIAT